MPEYISREEAVKKIKSCIMAANDAWESGYNTAMAEIMEWIKHMPSADVQPAPKWISVKDRLPDIEEGGVLVWIDDGIADDIRICDCLHIAYWYGDEKIFCDLKDSVIKGVTHWMYTSALPKPAKE